MRCNCRWVGQRVGPFSPSPGQVSCEACSAVFQGSQGPEHQVLSATLSWAVCPWCHSSCSLAPRLCFPGQPPNQVIARAQIFVLELTSRGSQLGHLLFKQGTSVRAPSPTVTLTSIRFHCTTCLFLHARRRPGPGLLPRSGKYHSDSESSSC